MGARREDDATLIQPITHRKGDDELFAELYRRYKNPIYSAALRITASPELADETVQEAGLKIMKHIDSLCSMPEDDLRKWLKVVVKNTALNLLRREKKYVLSDEEPDWVVHNAVENQSAYNTLLSLIRSMPEGTRDLLEMKFVLEYTNGEIAKLLGISENAVGVRIFRARAKLIALLREEGYNYE